MLHLLVLLLFTETSSSPACQSVGSVLFYKRDSRECWSRDDLARLRARKIFEDTILPELPPDKINAQYIKDVLRYFKRAMRTVEASKDERTQRILREALADTIGAHLRADLLPAARLAYYAGYTPYRGVKRLHDLFDKLKLYLNTQGLGWSRPRGVLDRSNLTVGKILIGPGRAADPCGALLVVRSARRCIRIPPPRVDDEARPAALALPFRSGGFVSLAAPGSENVLLDYYTTAARCILAGSPRECRHADFVAYNTELWHWMRRYVAPHLLDERLYAAYGGVLRVAAAVQGYGKGLLRRNIFDEEPRSDDGWRRLKCMLERKYYVDADWSPPLALLLVLAAAGSMCCLHLLYTYAFGRGAGCHCPRRRGPPAPAAEPAYEPIDAAFRAPQSPPPPAQVQARSKHTMPAAARPQRVYDLNRNTETVMAVLTSAASDSSSCSDEETTLNRTIVSLRAPPSPPKIEARVAQLRLEKGGGGRARGARGASTATASEGTYCARLSETAWSSSSGRSGSSASSASASSARSPSRSCTRSESRASPASRDLAWARRVLSKQRLGSPRPPPHALTTTTTTTVTPSRS